MSRILHDCSGRVRGRPVATRRQMLIRMGELGFGLTLPSLLAARPARGAGAGGRARSCILLFLSGGPSQYETFDPKPDAPVEVRGTFKPIRTNVPGIDICELLPNLARHADKYALVRSVTHTEANHPAGCYWMITGRKYPRSSSESAALSRRDHPHVGASLALLKPAASPAVPSFVMLPEQINPNGPIRSGQHAGFLGPAYDPMVVNANLETSDLRAGELKIQDGLTEGRLLRRRALLHQANLRSAWEAVERSVPPHYSRAFELLTRGEAAAAFDIDRETPAVRERYGRHLFGQSTLMARRLVEAGVRLVAVNWVRHDDGPGGQGWDSHSKHLDWCRDELMPPTDRAITGLITDLHERGLLDETLVVVMGEFGRTPQFNKDGGRDHWPHVFSVLMAGGGIRGGQVYGASTPDGGQPARDPVSPGDLAATLFHCLGVDHRQPIYDTLARPFPLAEGEIIQALL